MLFMCVFSVVDDLPGNSKTVGTIHADRSLELIFFVEPS